MENKIGKEGKKERGRKEIKKGERNPKGNVTLVIIMQPITHVMRLSRTRYRHHTHDRDVGKIPVTVTIVHLMYLSCARCDHW